MNLQHTLEKLRSDLFWLVDKSKGGKVHAHLRDISFILEDIYSQEVISKRQLMLDKLLHHAVATTKFYQPYKEYSRLSDFPIITKMDIREAFEDFLSQDSNYKASFEIATSGTTGIPFVVKQDANKKNRNTADTFYFGKKGGYEIGNRLYYIRFWSKETSRSRLGLFLTNIDQINVLDLSPSLFKVLTSNMIRDKSNKALLGYPSAFSELIRFMKAEKLKPLKRPFKSIITMAEGISEQKRSELQYFFGAPVISRYSNSENGIFAQQIPDEGDDYHINWASYEVEVLDLQEDKPARPGELGRIVITDLFNYCMPIIRYDTGDLGIMSKENIHFNGAPTLRSIEGRKMDLIYNTKGEPLSPFVGYEMEYFPELKQFQLIQEEKAEYTVKLNVEGIFHNESALVQRLYKHLGEDAVITIEYLDEFPQLASGKRRLTVNNYKG